MYNPSHLLPPYIRVHYLNIFGIPVAEFMGVRYRTNFGIGITASGAVGIMLVSGYAFAIRDHKQLFILLGAQVVATLPFIW